jgi:hypothetical protein
MCLSTVFLTKIFPRHAASGGLAGKGDYKNFLPNLAQKASIESIAMSNKNLFWLIIGVVFGIFATIWWIERRQTALALANHDNRISALEYTNDQRAIAGQTPTDKMKWYAGVLTVAGAALKLIFMLGHHKF